MSRLNVHLKTVKYVSKYTQKQLKYEPKILRTENINYEYIVDLSNL